MIAPTPTILHVLAPAPFGGLESVVRALSSGLAGAGVPVHVAAIDAPPPTLAWLAEGDAPVHAIEVPRRRYDLERRAIRRLAAETGAEVAHTHGYRPDVVDGGALRDLGLSLVTTVHGFTGGGLKNRLYEWLQVRAYRSYDAVIAVSRPLERELRRRVGEERVRLLPNAPAEGSPPLPRDEARRRVGIGPGESGPALAWIGRMSAEKNVSHAIRALAGSAHLGATLTVIGDGPDRGPAERLASALGLEGRVRWLGVVPDAGRLLTAFDALLLSSTTEGTPMVILEATAAGVPVVATAVGGVPDVLGADGPNLAPSGDVDGLAAAIDAVLGDPQVARDAVARARQGVSDLGDASTWIRRHIALYTELSRYRLRPAPRR